MEKTLIIKEKNVILKYIEDITCVLAFIFDINYTTSFKIINEKNYINNILDRYKFEDKETQEKVNKIKKLANEYIENKIKEGTQK